VADLPASAKASAGKQVRLQTRWTAARFAKRVGAPENAAVPHPAAGRAKTAPVATYGADRHLAAQSVETCRSPLAGKREAAEGFSEVERPFGSKLVAGIEADHMEGRDPSGQRP